MTFTGSGDANTQEDKRPGQSEERAKQSLFVDAGCKEEGQEKLKKETPELFVELKARSSLVT